jgi:hypothetical protein
MPRRSFDFSNIKLLMYRVANLVFLTPKLFKLFKVEFSSW